MAWKSARDEATRRDPIQEFADKIVAELERGVKPWLRPWDSDKCAGPQAPFNPTTGARYHGINVLILGMDLRAFQTGDPRWMTYQQAQEKKWQVRKGERATTIFFYKPLEIDDEKADDGTRIIPVLKHFAVFHASQIDGLPVYTPPPSRRLHGAGPNPPTSSCVTEERRSRSAGIGRSTARLSISFRCRRNTHSEVLLNGLLPRCMN